MCVPELGSIEEVNIRTVWPHEASCFTPWLADNISLLSEALGMDLEKGETEKQLGSLFVDILTKDSAGQTVVIENQLEATNPDHLGRLLIYATGLDARIVIWVATQFTDEHRAVVDWLNTGRREEVDFYGVEVRVVKIGDSLPAPEFRLVAHPNTWSRQTRQAAAPDKLGQFFQPLIDRLREHGLRAKRVFKRYIRVSSDFPEINYYVNMTGGARAKPVGVYLEIDTADPAINERVFSSLEADKEDIEAELGEDLEWKRQEKLQIIILRGKEASIDDPSEKLDETMDWILDRLLKLKQVFDPRLKKIVSQSPPEED